jgi:hypothetical protein
MLTTVDLCGIVGAEKEEVGTHELFGRENFA